MKRNCVNAARLADGLDFRRKDITRSPLGYDELYILTAFLDFLSQPENQNIDAALEDLVAEFTTERQEFASAQHSVRRGDKSGQKAEFAIG